MKQFLMYSNLRSIAVTTISLFLFGINGSAQCKEYIIGVNGDTLNCKDVKGWRQGKWITRVDEIRGEPGYEEEGEYKDDKKTGVWRVYTLQGDLMGVENYRYGHKHGQQQYFNTMGELVKEESWLASNPDQPTETVEVYDINDPKKVHLVQVKLEASTVPHGIWKVYEPGTGKLLQKQNFIFGKPDDGTGTANGILKNQEGSEPATTEKKEEVKEKPKPKEVMEYEKKNSGKKKIKVRTGETGG
jgi:hypothetical protein